MYAGVLTLDDEIPTKLLLKFYLYQGCLSQGFIVPIIAEYVLHRGLNYGQLGTLGGIFMVIWVTSEVPTGYLGDRFGRKHLLLLSSIGTGGITLSLAWIKSFHGFLVAYILWAVAVSLRSGAGSAWLYDLLKDRLNEDAYARITGHGHAVFSAVSAVTAIIGAQLATISWRYPFIANFVLLGASAVILLTLPKSGRFNSAIEDSGASENFISPKGTFRTIWRILRQTNLRWFILFTSILYGFIELSRTFVQPVSTNLGVTIAGLGLLYAGFNLVAAFTTATAGKVKETIGIENYFKAAPFLVGIPFIILVVAPLAAIPAFFIAHAATRLGEPLKRQFINDRIGSIERATGISAAMMISGLAAGLLRLAGGQVSDIIGPIRMLILFSSGLVIVSISMLGFLSPFETSETSTGVRKS